MKQRAIPTSTPCAQTRGGVGRNNGLWNSAPSSGVGQSRVYARNRGRACMCVYMCVCVCVVACNCACVSARVYAGVDARTCVCVIVRVCVVVVCVCALTCVHTCDVWLYVCVRACVSECACCCGVTYISARPREGLVRTERAMPNAMHG